MSVKPPIGTGRVRLIEIVGWDLQPCGGTHVRTTQEIATCASRKSKRRVAKPTRASCFRGAGRNLTMTAPPSLASRWLVSTDWLAARLDSPDTAVVDGSYYLPAMKRRPQANI
jgi:hypothetical protein